MTCHFVDRHGVVQTDLSRLAVEERLASGHFFWVDLHRPDEEDFALLRDVFGFHPLAIEDSQSFGQRAKLEDYDDYVFLVVFGRAPDEDGLVEVHCFYSDRFLVTVRRDDAPALTELRRHYDEGHYEVTRGVELLHQVVDGLVDSFVPAVADLDERLAVIEDEMLSRPDDGQLQDIFRMQRRLGRLRKVIVPQRDLFGRLAGGGTEIPGMTPEGARYFRDVYDHLVRLAETIDGQRELMNSAVNVYLSSASNRATDVMKQLTVIATIFLPLSFVVGFFGQNFPWMVEHIDGWPAFLVLGIGVELLTVAFLLTFFRRRGWF